MKKVNGLPMAYEFDCVKCPKCGFMCAMKIKSGPRTGMIECMSSDHIKPCDYFGDGTIDRRKNRKVTKKKIAKIWDTVKSKFRKEMEFMEENDLFQYDRKPEDRGI